MAQILDGKKIAGEVLVRLKSRPVPKQFFAGVLIGDDPASESFQKLKQGVARELGIDYGISKLSPELGDEGLREEVGRMAEEKNCGGVIVQLPLPEGLNPHYIVNAIPAEKDPDVLGERALGAFYNGSGVAVHPAAATVWEILKQTNFNLEGKKVAIVGPGTLIGKPVAVSLLGKVSNLYVLGRGSDMSLLKNCDLVILGVGKAGLVTPDMLKEGVGVIDFGYSPGEKLGVNGKPLLRGDFDSSDAALCDARLAFYTPTPGGTGPILVSKLFENFYALNSE
ncbi:MAG: bifunctional 5,10-methylenetetrahydrofolate dehydrogenase/5,10-methenyltetrahydrofolate cyclohydrolase [Candidatus Liptonbacteria bacterium]|nr:bifunctional 5,10-methylenetetrahydrofolate dehydrogenase/5,10-methenyltetrahydrofolate cyclohydrolase [Candidatus Liptonbacteria bacterium]